MNIREQRIELLREAYLSGKTFKNTNEIREFLGLPRTGHGSRIAYKCDIAARNSINADPTTPVVIPAAKVPDEDKSYARRSRGNADHDLAKAVAFAQEVTSKASNLTYQMRKVSDKHPKDLDLMILSRDVAVLGQEAVALKVRIDRIKDGR